MQRTLADTVDATSVAAQLVSEVSYNLAPDHEERVATEVGELTLELALGQLSKDLAEAIKSGDPKKIEEAMKELQKKLNGPNGCQMPFSFTQVVV